MVHVGVLVDLPLLAVAHIPRAMDLVLLVANVTVIIGTVVQALVAFATKFFLVLLHWHQNVVALVQAVRSVDQIRTTFVHARPLCKPVVHLHLSVRVHLWVTASAVQGSCAHRRQEVVYLAELQVVHQEVLLGEHRGVRQETVEEQQEQVVVPPAVPLEMEVARVEQQEETQVERGAVHLQEIQALLVPQHQHSPRG